MLSCSDQVAEGWARPLVSPAGPVALGLLESMAAAAAVEPWLAALPVPALVPAGRGKPWPGKRVRPLGSLRSSRSFDVMLRRMLEAECGGGRCKKEKSRMGRERVFKRQARGLAPVAPSLSSLLFRAHARALPHNLNGKCQRQ